MEQEETETENGEERKKQSKCSITNCQIDVVNKALKIEEGEIEIFANRTVGFSRM